jgi:hypothetical protein
MCELMREMRCSDKFGDPDEWLKISPAHAAVGRRLRLAGCRRYYFGLRLLTKRLGLSSFVGNARTLLRFMCWCALLVRCAVRSA